MKVRLLSTFTLFFFIFVLNAEMSEGKSPPTAKEGHIPFDQWDFQQEGITELDGEWEFYWDQLLEPGDFTESGSRIKSYYMEVPHAWYQSSMNGDNLPHEGYATYRLTVDLHEDDQDQLLSVYISRVYSAHKIWINDELLYEQGVVGENRPGMEPDEYSQALPFQTDSDQMEIVLQVSNFTQRAGGMWESILIGTEEDVSSYREGNVVETMFFVGSLITMGLVFICFYLFRRNNRSPLYFGILCVAIALQTFLQGDKFSSLDAPYWNWMMGYKLEYLVNTVALGSFTLFVRVLFPQEMKRRAWQAILLFCISYGIFVTVTPPYIFSHTMLFFQIIIIASLSYIMYVFVRAIINRRRGAVFHILGFSVLFLALLFDILFYNQVVSEQTFLYYGMFFYIFMQALHLSMLFAESYTRVEDLSSTLDEKVKSRTRELREKNEDLNYMQTMRSQLMLNISHELGTPLTSIRGYVKGMLDGVFPRGDDKYIQLVYDKTLLLDRFVGDLHDLSKLENQQISFVYEQVNIRMFLRHLYDTYEPEITKSGQRFIYNDARVDRADISVRMDPDRIEQVFANLLFNATRYSAEDGTINVELDMEKEHAVISFIDSGIGIEAEELPFVFDRFYKKTSEDGFGIGLTICKEIIEQHNGEIGVQSEVDVGSRFYFKLPLQ